jgi:hypothetical protein
MVREKLPMETLAKYWKIMRLQGSGDIVATDRPTALQHLNAEYGEFADQDPLPDRALQILLARQLQQSHVAAALCLRCFASYYILMSCQRLVKNYGQHYGFGVLDLVPVTLNDDGSLAIEIVQHEGTLSIQRPQNTANKQGNRFQPLAFRILEKFDPEKSGLGTWASRLTWQDAKLKKLLKEEYGILMIGDWALLNDTQPSTFQRILIKHFNFPDPALEQAKTPAYAAAIKELNQLVAALQVYHDVYVAEHTPKRGRACPEPTIAQCQRMMAQLQLSPGTIGSPDSAEAFRSGNLMTIADYIRRHRLKLLPPSDLAQRPSASSDTPIIPEEFLQLFNRYLGLAVTQAITQRLEHPSMKPEKASNILKVLDRQYRQGMPQGDIAKDLGFPRQDTVSKLLDFKHLKIGIIGHMSERLKNDTPLLAEYFNDADRLNTLLDQVEAYLDVILREDGRWRYTPLDKRQAPSQLASAIGDFLEQYRLHP